jgi:hypothetical protein
VPLIRSSKYDAGSLSSASCSLTGVAAHNCLVFRFGSTNGSHSFPSLTSPPADGTNTYTQATTNAGNGDFGTGQWLGVYTAKDVAAGNVTCSVTAAETITWAILEEWSGIDTTSPVDAVANAAFDSTAAPSVNLTTVAASTVVTGTLSRSFFAGTESPGAGYTLIQDCSSSGALSEYETQSSAGTYAVTGVLGGADACLITGVSLKVAGGGVTRDMAAAIVGQATLHETLSASKALSASIVARAIFHATLFGTGGAETLRPFDSPGLSLSLRDGAQVTLTVSGEPLVGLATDAHPRR